MTPLSVQDLLPGLRLSQTNEAKVRAFIIDNLVERVDVLPTPELAEVNQGSHPATIHCVPADVSLRAADNLRNSLILIEPTKDPLEVRAYLAEARSHRNKILWLDSSGKKLRLRYFDFSADINLTLVIPVYGVADQLPELMESVKPLVGDDVEILFVNDGSPDNSARIIEDWIHTQPSGSKIELLTKENGGCYSARNYGLNVARGRFIQFVDGDDAIEPRNIAYLLVSAIENDVDIARGGFTTFQNASELNSDFDNAPSLAPSWHIGQAPFILDQPAIWANLYNKRFLSRYGFEFPALPRFDDLPFHLVTSFMARITCTMQAPVYHYRLGRDGQDIAADDEKLFTVFDIYDGLESGSLPATGAAWNLLLLRSMRATFNWTLPKLRTDLRPQFLSRARVAKARLSRKVSLLERTVERLKSHPTIRRLFGL